ncbi:MAG: hypothetical protein AB4206_12090 [Xenococcaceae cyanobacterium]
MGKRLFSEQLPSDGSFQMHKILDAANERLGKLGKHGKRCKLKLTGNTVSLQFNFGGQKQKGSGCSYTKDGIREAEKIAAMVTNQLVAGQYSDKWLNSLLGRSKPNEAKKQLTCAEMITEYKEYWFRENVRLKSPMGAWTRRFRHLDAKLTRKKEPINEKTIREIIEVTDKNSFARTSTIQALICFCDYFSLNEFEKIIKHYKAGNKPKTKTREVPSDNLIASIYHLRFEPKPNCPKNYLHRYAQWQFLYGLLATYGLRVHEAWNIANWDKPVTLQDGDWVEINLGDDDSLNLARQHQGGNKVIPSITDPNNKRHILAIKRDTKTGFRMAIPLSPKGYDWIEEFNLVSKLNLPDIDNPLEYENKDGIMRRCTGSVVRWFRRNNYGFSAHALRHAYNHRAHQLGLYAADIADSLGHSITMNQGTYLKSRNIDRKIEMANEAADRAKNKQSEVEKLKARIEYLEAENEKLRTELKMYKILEKKS